MHVHRTLRLVFCQSVNDFQKFIRRGGYTHFESAANHETQKFRQQANP